MVSAIPNASGGKGAATRTFNFSAAPAGGRGAGSSSHVAGSNSAV